MSKSVRTEQAAFAGDGRAEVRWYRPVMTAAAVLVAVGVLFGGCTQEAWQRENWTWNPFKKDKTTSPDAGSKARRPSNSATASNTPPRTNPTNAKTAPKPAESNDPKAEQVNRDVEAYAQRFPAKGQAGSTQAGSPQAGPTASGSNPRTARSNPAARPNTTARTTAKPASSGGTNADGGASAASTARSSTSSTPVATRSNPPARPAPEDNGGELTLIGSTPTTDQPASNGNINIGAGSARQVEPTPIATVGSSTTGGSSPKSEQPIGSGESRPAETMIASAPPVSPSSSEKPAITPDKPVMTSPDKPATPGTEERPPVIGTIHVEPGSDADIVETPPPTPSETKTVKPSPAAPTHEEKKTVGSDSVKPIPTEPKIDTATDAAKPMPAESIQPKTSERAKSPVIESSKPIATETPGKSATANTPPTSNSPLAGLESAVAQDPNNIDKQLKLRMAYLLNDDEERAMAPTPGMSEDTQKVVLAQIKAMISAKGATGRDAASAAQAQLASAEAIRTAAKDKADLQVPRVVLCTSIRRFGDYTPIAPLIFPTGKKNQALLYIEVENYQSRQTKDGQYEVLLSMRESLLDAKGKELWAFQTPKIQDISRAPREDFFLSTQPRTIPPGLPAGEYAYKVEVEDLIAGKINSNLTKFKLVATQPN